MIYSTSKTITSVSEKPKIIKVCTMELAAQSAVLLLDNTLKRCSIIINNEEVGYKNISYQYATIAQYRRILESSFSEACEELNIPKNFSSMRLKQTFVGKTLEGDAKYKASLVVRIFSQENYSIISEDIHEVEYVISKNTFEYIENSSTTMSGVMQGEGSKTTYLERYGIRRLLSCGNESEEKSFEKDIAKNSFNKITEPKPKRAIFNKETEVSSEKVKQWLDAVSKGKFIPKEDFPIMMRFLEKEGTNVKSLDSLCTKEKLITIKNELSRVYYNGL